MNDLRPYQIAVMDHLSRRNMLLDWEMGLGKTRVVIEHIRSSKTRRTLIACPLGVMPVWEAEWRKWGMGEHRIVLLRGSVTKKAHTMQSTIGVAGPRAFVVNYDSIWRGRLGEEILKHEWDLVVADECHKLKTPSSRVSVFFNKLRRRARHRIGLSGTPLGQGPLDIYGQARFIEPETFQRTAAQFRATYAIYGGPSFGGRPRILQGYQNLQDFRGRYARLAHVIKRDQVMFDLPKVTWQQVPVELSDATARAYEDISEMFVAQVKRGEITAQNALAKAMRLQQITSGIAATDDGTYRLSNEKAVALREILNDLPADRSVVVFARFIIDLDNIREAAEAEGRQVDELSGRRDDVRGVWRPEDGSVLAVQYQSGGVGVDLTAACYAVFYSATTSGTDWAQSQKRVDRPGQGLPMTFYTLDALANEKTTVDQKIAAAHDRRSRLTDAIGYDVSAEVLGLTNEPPASRLDMHPAHERNMT